MSPALGEPPDSGVIASPNALPAKASSSPRAARRATARAPARRVGRGAKGTGILFTGRVAKAAHAAWSSALEHRLPPLAERPHALREVARAGQFLLDLGLEVELAGQVRVQPPVELP